MKFIKRLIQRKRNKVVASAIKIFIQNYHHGEILTAQQARENLERGLVEIIWPDGQHAGNGLLITENGYFITARHCLTEGLDTAGRIRNNNGRTYQIKSVPITGNGRQNKTDIALARAEIPGEVIPVIYRFSTKAHITHNSPAAIFTRWDGKVSYMAGFVDRVLTSDYVKKRKLKIEDSEEDVSNHFVINVKVKRGYSGSPIMSPEMHLMGILTYGESGKWQEYGMAIGIEKVLHMLHYYSVHLQR